MTRLVAAACVAALLIAGGATTRVGVDAWRAADELRRVAVLTRELRDQLSQVQPAEAAATLDRLQDATTAARQATAGPAWRLARQGLGGGRQLATVATLATAADDLAHQALPPLVDTAADLRPAALTPSDQTVDIAAVSSAAPAVRRAEAAVRRVREQVAALPRADLVPPLRDALTELDSALARAVRDTAAAVRASTLIGPMLGADEPRTYLLLFQNPAEVRATGGMPGAFAVVTADRGRLTLVEHGSAGRDLRTFDEPVLPLDETFTALYTERPGRYPANVNLTPDFPTAAALAREMYRRRTGVAVDGVLATDPVALSYLLRALGPVSPPAGPVLTADTVVEQLLVHAYARADSARQQDAYFADAAGAVFAALVDGRGDARATVRALSRAVAERRLLAYSAHPAEQRLLEQTALAGRLPTDDGHRPTVGVFLNDGSATKLSYYLAVRAGLSAGECRADGRRQIRLRLTMASHAPSGGLPESVLGLQYGEDDPYTVRTNVSLFTPAGGALVRVRLDGEPEPVGSGRERSRVVGIVPVTLAPGERRTLTATLLTAPLPPAARTAVELAHTPTATPWNIRDDLYLKCQLSR